MICERSQQYAVSDTKTWSERCQTKFISVCPKYLSDRGKFIFLLGYLVTMKDFLFFFCYCRPPVDIHRHGLLKPSPCIEEKLVVGLPTDSVPTLCYQNGRFRLRGRTFPGNFRTICLRFGNFGRIESAHGGLVVCVRCHFPRGLSARGLVVSTLV